MIGYVGETNARTIIFNGLSVDGADSYSMVIDYGDGENYEVDITDGTYTVDGSVLKRAGSVACQILAKKANADGTSYTLVKKSNMFTLIIGKSIEGEPAPIPTYEQALSILDNIIEQAGGVIDIQLINAAIANANTATAQANQAKADAEAATEAANAAAQTASAVVGQVAIVDEGMGRTYSVKIRIKNGKPILEYESRRRASLPRGSRTWPPG